MCIRGKCVVSCQGGGCTWSAIASMLGISSGQSVAMASMTTRATPTARFLTSLCSVVDDRGQSTRRRWAGKEWRINAAESWPMTQIKFCLSQLFSATRDHKYGCKFGYLIDIVSTHTLNAHARIQMSTCARDIATKRRSTSNGLLSLSS